MNFPVSFHVAFRNAMGGDSIRGGYYHTRWRSYVTVRLVLS